jgi:hypothetical protein
LGLRHPGACIVHRQPEGGRYTDVQVYAEGQTIAPLAKRDAGFRVSLE